MISLDPADILPNFSSVSDTMTEAPLLKPSGKDLP